MLLLRIFPCSSEYKSKNDINLINFEALDTKYFEEYKIHLGTESTWIMKADFFQSFASFLWKSVFIGEISKLRVVLEYWRLKIFRKINRSNLIPW